MSEPSTANRSRNRVYLLATFAIFICLFAHLGAIGLVGPDEPRYAWIARAMATTGDWVTPRLYGQPWFEKPALYYWAAAAGFLLHLPAESAARLPSALAALAAALAISWLGRRFYENENVPDTASPALLAPLVFSTTVAAVGFARAAAPDMLFAAAVTLDMAFAARLLESAGALRPGFRRSSEASADGLAQALFGAFLGLAVLAKGPAGIVLAGGAIGLWALATKRWRDSLRLAHPVVIGCFCAVALPWYVICALRNPEFLRVFIVQHNFERYLTPLFEHPEPFWFFGPITLLAVFPWIALLWPVLQWGFDLWREKTWDRSPSFFFACWAVFPVIFFSFSESKLPGYILPAVPALSLLLSVARARATGGGLTQGRANSGWLGAALGLTWVALGVGALVWLKHLSSPMRDDVRGSIFLSAGITVAGGLWIALDGIFRKRISFLLMVLLTVLCVEIAGMQTLPSLDPYLSARSHAQLLRNDAHPDRILTYQLPRSSSYGLAFYLGRELPEWNPGNPDSALILTTPKGLEQMRKLGRFRGDLDEPYKGILYVPAFPAPREH